jgi:hypothetical protein
MKFCQQKAVPPPWQGVRVADDGSGGSEGVVAEAGGTKITSAASTNT